MRENKKLYLYFIGFSLFGISIQVFMPYLIIYYSVSLGMDNYVLIMAPAIILASAFTALWGRIYDRQSFARSVTVPLVMLGLGYISLSSSAHFL